MQQFLVNHGFQVAQDGVLGAQTKAAALAFRTNHKGGAAWSAKNGIGTHPGIAPSGPIGPVGGAPGAVTGAGAGAAPGSTDPTSTAAGAFQQLLNALLSKSGSVGTTMDPTSFGNAAAASDTAATAADGMQIKQNPLQEAQNQQDISSWYGLDPKASSFKLSVLGRLAQAKTGDAAAATAGSSNVASLAQALASSIGGSANDGSSTVAAAGANDAGTLAALGTANTDYENNMAPLLAAEATGAKSQEKGSNQAALLQLLQQRAADQGKAVTDRATGVASAIGANNGVDQQRFADQGNLLSTLAQVAAVDPNAAPMKDAELQSIIDENNAKAHAIATGGSVSGRAAAPKTVNLGSVTANVTNMLGVGSDRKLPKGTSLGAVARLIGSQLQAEGIQKTDPRYQRLAQTIIGSYLLPDGSGVNVPAGWFGPNTQ